MIKKIIKGVMKEKKSNYKRLRHEELQFIFLMRSEGKSFQEIGNLLSRSKGCVNKAYNLYRHPRNEVWRRMSYLEKARHVYDQMQCNKRTKKTFCGNLKSCEIRKYVYDGLTIRKLTPEQISAKIKVERPGQSISFKTIYKYTKGNVELQQYLYEKGKTRRQNVSGRRSRFKEAAPKKRSIHEREEIVNNRERSGDWEGDTIVSCRKGKGAVLSLVERESREKFFRKIPDLKSRTVFDFFITFLHLHSDVKTITLDNGVEFSFSELIELERRCPNLKIYYCDSYKSQQKGSVERSNRDFRKYFPKGTDFSKVTQAEVIQVQNELNSMPLKIFGFKSPLEMKNEFNEQTSSQIAA